MTSSARTGDSFRPWELRLLERTGMSPVLAGVSVTGVLVASWVVVYLVIGLPLMDPDALFGLREGPRNFLFSSVLFGYSLGAFGYVLAGGEQDRASVGLTDVDTGDARLALRSRLFGATNVFFGYLIIETVQRGSREGATALDLIIHPEYTPATILMLVSFWVMGRFLHASLQTTSLDERLRAPVDLYDLRPFLVLGRMSLRRSLAMIGLIAIQMPWVFIPGFGRTFIPLMAVALVAPTLLLLVPTRGARARIRAAKRTEMDRISLELRATRNSAIEGNPAAQTKMTFLLADRNYIAAVHEWPFEGSSLRRFGLYLLLPLGSWGASALVERSINALLD